MNITNIINTIQKNKNIKYGILLLILLILLIIYFVKTITKTKTKTKKQTIENFQLTDQSIQDFLKIQNTNYPHKNFDMEKIQQQTSQEEMNYFLQNRKWPWSQKVIDLYTEAISNNKLIRSDPLEAIEYARTIYNQQAIMNILSYQTKEGDFLINGLSIHNTNPKTNPNPLEDLPSGYGSFGYESGLITEKNDIIKCNIDPFNNNSHLEKTHYTGKGGIFGEQTKKITPLNYNNLEAEIPGFKFIDGPCNPCSIFNNPSDYSCRYQLNIKNHINNNNENEISSVWKYLWKM
jgi:hypothetical protein